MANNTEVIQAWLDGHKAKSQNRMGGLNTDGINLYSYVLMIAKGRQILDYTKGGDYDFQSKTTSRHVELAKQGLQERNDGKILNRSKFIYGHS